MSKVDKKRTKLQERIKHLENEMLINLKQKTSNTKEISLGDYQNKIAELNKQLNLLK